MRANDLVAEVTPLSHNERARRVIAMGRAAVGGDTDAQRALADVGASPDTFARTLALQATFVTRDARVVLAALQDPSRTMRLRAARLVALVCTDAQAADALRGVAGRSARKRLLIALKRARRQAAIDLFVGGVAPDAEAALLELVPFGSLAVVARVAPSVAETLGPDGWRRLAKHAAPVAVDLVLRALDATNAPPDPRLRWRVGSLTRLLAKRAPRPALALLQRLFEVGEEPGSPLVRGLVGGLLRALPTNVFDLLRSWREGARPAKPPGPFGIVRFDAVAHRLGPERLAYLVEHAPSTLSDDVGARRWFLRLGAGDRVAVVDAWLRHSQFAWGGFLLRHLDDRSPAVRERAYRRWSAAAQDTHGVIPPARLDALPAELRACEARRHLDEVAYLATRSLERVVYARLLPFADAKVAVAPLLGHPEGEMRAPALRALLGAIRHEPASLPDGLDAVLARAFEQDPVRLAMLDALGGLPVSLFRAEHLERVGRAVKDALDAADLSPATAAAAERLVVRLFRVDAAWGAPWLTRILEARGSLSALGLGAGLLPRDVRAFDPVLASLARAWAEREQAGAVLWLASSLGARRLRHAPSLLDALESIVKRLPFAGVAGAGLALLRREAPRRFAALVPALLAEDRSFVRLPDVAAFVAHARQDLLFLVVGDAPLRGRFATGETRVVVDFGVHFGRWSAEAQARYGRQLGSLAAPEKVDTPTARFAIERLARLAFVAPTSLIDFASDNRRPVRELAVRALAWVDGPAALDTLVSALADDRARWAIYALRRLMAEMARADVIARLRAVPMQKITVAKEVVRLLGELGGADGFAELMAIDRPGLHRDVRIALLRALWDHLERPEAWGVLERAVDDADWVLASRVADVPYAHLSDVTERRLAGLFARVLSRTEADARVALLQRAVGLPLRDADRTLFGALLAHMGHAPDEAVLATRAVLARMLPGEVDAVGARVEELLPARRTLVAILPVLRPSSYAPAHQRAVASRALAALGRDPRVVPLQIDLAGHLLGYADLAALLVDLARRDLLHADAMTAATEAATRCLHPDLLEQTLANNADARLRRLALAALAHAAGPGRGWCRQRRARLDHYRADPSPFVSGAAELVFPPAATKEEGAGP